jgi:hypothetical protein
MVSKIADAIIEGRTEVESSQDAEDAYDDYVAPQATAPEPAAAEPAAPVAEEAAV